MDRSIVLSLRCRVNTPPPLRTSVRVGRRPGTARRQLALGGPRLDGPRGRRGRLAAAVVAIRPATWVRRRLLAGRSPRTSASAATPVPRCSSPVTRGSSGRSPLSPSMREPSSFSGPCSGHTACSDAHIGHAVAPFHRFIFRPLVRRIERQALLAPPVVESSDR